MFSEQSDKDAKNSEKLVSDDMTDEKEELINIFLFIYPSP